jgi:hypothetical protein
VRDRVTTQKNAENESENAANYSDKDFISFISIALPL